MTNAWTNAPDTPGVGTPSIGAPIDRVDGHLKVTGGARYSAEMPVENVAYAVMVTSTIARGRVRSADTAAAERAQGVIAVYTPANAPKLPTSDKALLKPPEGRKLTTLQDDKVYYNGQPIGLVVADTLDHAMAAAELVRFTYDAERPELDMATAPRGQTNNGRPGGNEPPTSNRGDVDAGLAAAAVHVDQTYTTPIEQHNPMELHATLSVWNGDRVTVYDATQGIFGVRNTIAKAFQLPPENVRVVSYFVG
ncbi:MAG TPA: molybdopterin cofactor-binding domain-containing protein, partial [Gemmatirosa sp.]